MRTLGLFSLLPLAVLVAPATAFADPDRLNNPAPPTVAPPPAYSPPPPVSGYNAPPPVTGYNQPPVVMARPQPVMMAPPPPIRPVVQAPPAPVGRQGLFVGVQGGAAIPLTGDYSAVLGTGFMGLGHIGWATVSGISVRAELGVRSNGFTPTDLAGTSQTSVFYGAGLRWTAPRSTLRPYGEVLVDAFSTLAQASSVSGTTTTTTTTSTGTGVTIGAAVGAEIEISNTFSLELAVRYDHIVLAGGEEALTGSLLGVVGGGTFYF